MKSEAHVTEVHVTLAEAQNSRENLILSTFHFSISISRHFHFTFHSRSRSQGIFISLFILEMSERKTKFTFQFSKRVNAFQISLFFLMLKNFSKILGRVRLAFWIEQFFIVKMILNEQHRGTDGVFSCLT